MASDQRVWLNMDRDRRHAVVGEDRFTLCGRSLMVGSWLSRPTTETWLDVDCRQCRARREFKAAMKEAQDGQ